MTIEIVNGITVLTSDEDKFLTNGDTYSQKVYLGKNDSPDNWCEVDEIPSEEVTAEQALAELVEVLE